MTFRVIGLPLFISEMMFAILLLKPMTWFDTGLYHLGAIRWLSQHGLVPGLALINQKFGFISSWFAFSAPLTPQFLGDHIGAVSNGFLLVLTACTLLLIINHWKQQKTLTLEDAFLTIFLIALSVFYLAVWAAGEPLLLSFSHDLAVNYSVGIFGWLILLIAKARKERGGVSSGQNHHSFRNIFFNIDTLLIILAFCILSFKLTGLFFIPIAYLFFLSQDPTKWERWLVAFLMGVVLILPLAIAQLTTSGCFLYPAQSFCLDLPWTVPAHFIDAEAAPIVGEGFFGFLSDGFFAALINTWHSLREALIYNTKVRVGTLLLVMLVVIIIWRVLMKKFTPPGEMWVLMTAIGGSLFIFLINKYVIFRFGGGIVLLLPTYLTAILMHNLVLNQPRFMQTLGARSNRHHHKTNHLSLFYISVVQHWQQSLKLVTLCLYAVLISMNLPIIASHILVPPVLPQAQLVRDRSHDISYTYPSDWTIRCWNADLPCSPNLLPDIRLRAPEAGLKGGFVITSGDKK